MYTRRLLQLVCIASWLVMLSCEDAPVKPASVTIALSSNSTENDLKEPGTSTIPTTPTPTAAVTSAGPDAATTIPTFATTQRWNVTDKDGHVCIVLQSGIRMSFRYKDETPLHPRFTHKQTEEEVEASTDVPTNAVAEGECGLGVQTINLLFYNDWNLTLAFTLNSSDSEYRLAVASLSYSIQNARWPFPKARSFSNSSAEKIHEGASDFHTKSGTSSVCTSQVTLLNNSSPGAIGLLQVNMYDTRLEAFRYNITNSEFSVMGSRCSNDELSFLIPIIVGACLGGLIVIVIVAYIIGRHHSKKRYYMNV